MLYKWAKRDEKHGKEKGNILEKKDNILEKREHYTVGNKRTHVCMVSGTD